MKKGIIFTLVILILSISGCNNKQDNTEINKPVEVETKTVHVEKINTTINYMGIVNSDFIKKYSFKTSGKVQSINVVVGQKINEGEILMELDKSDLQLQVNAAKNQADSAYSQYQKTLSGAQNEDLKNAQLNVEKAQLSYDFAKKTFGDVEILYKEEAVSETNYQEAKLNFDIASKELEQAKELLKKAQGGARKEDISSAKSQYELSKTNYDATLKMYNESTIVSDITGYVTDILYEVSEIVPQGYPAILIQSENQIISIGVTQEDIEKLHIGMDAKISINNYSYNGKIVNINQTPDESSRTFNVDIKINNEDKKLYIGTIGTIEIITGFEEGIWLEIPYILNDGKDYVYIVENDVAIRKNITVNKLNNDKALISNLSDNNIVIISKKENIKDGYNVKIVTNK